MNRALIHLLPLLLAACGSDVPPTAGPAPVAAPASVAEAGDPAAGIDWFDGTVEEAFAAAAEARKPVYLYWGAVWCPPCYAISETVFKRPEFIERSRLFVPVYLDGDQEDAQSWGEHFGVRGYPTMIVFDPDGEELTRIPGGIDIQAYANVLDLTLGEAAPVRSVVDRVMASDARLDAADCTLLAYYSWGQDTRILEDADRAAAFRRMHEACPKGSRTERSILHLAWLSEAVAAEDPASALAAEPAALDRFLEIVGDPGLARANVLTIILSGARITAALTGTGTADRDRAVAALEAAYERIAADPEVYKRERIYTLLGRLNLERLDDPEAEASAELRRIIRETVAWADETTPGVYQRQPIVNALANVLLEAGMDEVARPLLLAELDRTRQPYYFMPALAEIEQRAGNDEAALDWLRRAHDASTGPATRFQWGFYYIAGLLEMAPDDGARIHDTTVSVIEELQRSAGFFQRPKSQLSLLERRLLGWGQEGGRQDELRRIRESVLAVCARMGTGEAARATCEAFLAEA